MLLHQFINQSAHTTPDAAALQDAHAAITYSALAQRVAATAAGFLALGLLRGERVAFYLDKRIEAVLTLFGAAAAGGVFVPINPLLKPMQVAHILRDCGARLLVTSNERLALLRHELAHCPALQQVIVLGAQTTTDTAATFQTHSWQSLASAVPNTGHRVIDADPAAILYTSGSTGQPKGVVLSHRNLVVGAESVAHYLGNHAGDRILCALPLSFDYGLSQVTTAFHVGASVLLINYLLPHDVLTTLQQEKITGLAAVPPLWIQLAQLDWPANIDQHLRYFTNSGGVMPAMTLAALRARVPRAKPYLMYGLTEAFRSTYLPPDEIDRRPNSIGRAIPNAEVLVLRPDGTPCDVDEPGELVHCGPLVALGYWNDADKTAERFKPLPHRADAKPEIAVFSGDTVRQDAAGFLYFMGRNDDMIKTSGYRVSPSEVVDVVYGAGLVQEAAAIGVPHPLLGQSIMLVVHAADNAPDNLRGLLLATCKAQLPGYMTPTQIFVRTAPLPRNQNGKIDRRALAIEYSPPIPGAPT